MTRPFRRLKILFVLPALTAGGAERVLLTLMNGLDRSRFEPVLIAVNGSGPMGALADKDIPQIILGHGRFVTSLPRLLRQLRRHKPDVIVSTMAHMNFAVLLCKPFLPKTRFIVREAITPSFILARHPVIAPAIKAAYKFLYRRADLVVSPAQVIIDEFARDLGMDTGNHRVLYNPVDTGRLRASQALPPRQNQRTVHFICAGRLHPQKGFSRLIAALPALDIPEWRLTILGEGPERARLEALVRENALEGHVFLPGHTDTPWPLIAGADAFLLPSLFEGLPNVVLEALACGTRVIASREAGGITEIAAVAAQGDVRIADNISDFITMMGDVAAAPAIQFRPSKLPPLFEKPVAVARFTAMLEGPG